MTADKDKKTPEKGSDKQGASEIGQALQRQAGADRPHGSAEVKHTHAYDIWKSSGQYETFVERWFNLGAPTSIELAVFCREFATLIEVGFSVVKSLRMLAVRTRNRRLRIALEDTVCRIEEGESVHAAMRPHTAVFTPLVVNIIQVSETAGILEESLIRLAGIMEGKANIRRRVVSAMAYPLVAVTIAFLVVILLMTIAVPIFARTYMDLDQELPAVTEAMLWLSRFLVSWWWAILLVVIAMMAGGSYWRSTPSGHRSFSWLVFQVPVLSGISQKIAIARTSRTLAGLVGAGIPLSTALAITADTSENELVAEQLRKAREDLEAGGSVAESLSHSALFPALMLDMLSVGEQTGTMETMLNKLADVYEADSESTLNGLATVIEPLLIVLLGGIILLVGMAILVPYFNLADWVL